LHTTIFFYIKDLTPGRHVKKMSELLFIGTGGSVATEQRDNTSFLLLDRKNVLLVDCPGSVIQKLKKAQIDPLRVHTLVVTHIHPDHIYGLPSLIHSLMLDDCSIEIFGSEKSMKFCADLLDLFHLRSEKIKCRVALHPVEDDETYPVYPGLTCSFHRVPHSPSSMAVGFQLSEETVDLLYSGDTPRNPELLQKTENLDLLIHDCSAPSRFFKKYPSLHHMHTDSRTLGEMAQEAGVRHLIPCHFFGELDYTLGEIEEEIRENYKGTLTIPEDFSRITVNSL
jgi:ribonuclease Z